MTLRTIIIDDETHVVVPRVATDDQVLAAFPKWSPPKLAIKVMKQDYAAMIEAAPKHETQTVSGEPCAHTPTDVQSELTIAYMAGYYANKQPDHTALLKEMVQALRFYADEENHTVRSETLSCGCCSDIVESKVDEDNGNRAREALTRAERVIAESDNQQALEKKGS